MGADVFRPEAAVRDDYFSKLSLVIGFTDYALASTARPSKSPLQRGHGYVFQFNRTAEGGLLEFGAISFPKSETLFFVLSQSFLWDGCENSQVILLSAVRST